MDFWTAIVSIVAIAIGSDVINSALKRRHKTRLNQAEQSEHRAKLESLEAEVQRLRAENEMLTVALEEHKILADEAVTTFGSRLERLKTEQQRTGSPQMIPTADEVSD